MIPDHKCKHDRGAAPPLALAVIIALVLFGGLFYFLKNRGSSESLPLDETAEISESEPRVRETAVEPEIPDSSVPVEPVITEAEPDNAVSPSKLPDVPAESMALIAALIIDEDWQGLRESLDKEVLSEERFALLVAGFEDQGFRIRSDRAVSQIAQTRDLQRWALNLIKGETPVVVGRLEFDFTRPQAGEDAWRLSRVYLPNEDPVEVLEPSADAIAVADQFLQALTKQDFAGARQHVDPRMITDARIAGLCILFEEGEFALKEDEPLVATIARDDVTWFVAQIVSPATGTESHFGMVLHRDAEQPWLITEVNLERFLAAYARRFGHGDIYYTPIIQNPEKGDSVAVFFEFNDANIDDRTMRQIEVIANAAKGDLSRRLVVEGHTDIVGDDAYNMQLSVERSDAVRGALFAFGVDPSQVDTRAHGATQPRRSNFLPDGSDNPEGRRVNRRVEIFLDF